MGTGLKFGPVNSNAVHLCVDMQRIFTGSSPWSMPWFERVLPNICVLVDHRPSHTLFTRFIPPRSKENTGGTWSRYYEKWNTMTLDHLLDDQVELVPELKSYVPPARVLDKTVYSPWHFTQLHQNLGIADVDTLLVSGGETDVCVLATVLGAVDLGYRVVLVSDAVCSSSDEAHDAMQRFYAGRLSRQVETAETREILANW
ncbi:cysteine hydrolase [Phyllobacterium sp. SB3]|uniref:cysteine hydrolase family protein n=1 Tax=Phyllobacterium sp. SB3 TaxID=3156073 RepID=UPI0032B00C78